MIKTVISDRKENSKKVFTVFNKNYVAVWISKEYRFDTELVKNGKDYVVFKTILGYEAYWLVPSENGFVAEPFDYNEVLSPEEIESFDEYYKNIHPYINHPEVDFTPEQTYHLLERSEKSKNMNKWLMLKF